jgi:ADP-ribose pyrophosphatase YjhB (NUDIX family)
LPVLSPACKYTAATLEAFVSRIAIIPDARIPHFCPFKDCGHPISETERARRTHPFRCSNTQIEKPHVIFISPNPVSVHMLFVRLPDGRLGVCFGRRGLSYEVAFGKWSLPSGFIEAETGFEAAIDEFNEELRVDVSGIPVEHVAEHYDPDTFCSLHFYAGFWPHAEPPQLQTTKESSEVNIFPIDELPDNLAFPYQKAIILRVAERFTARGL